MELPQSLSTLFEMESPDSPFEMEVPQSPSTESPDFPSIPFEMESPHSPPIETQISHSPSPQFEPDSQPIQSLQQSESSQVATHNVPHNFDVGDTFCTYKELQAKVKLYEASHSVQLSHRDSRTLEAAKKRTPHRIAGANTDLVYYTICLVCIFGGKKYQSTGTGERACQRYVGRDCQIIPSPARELSKPC